ncbi:MAG: hypothetical protein ABJK37_12415 [Paraglaciecola sp.]|uniref:hypothetical protein n=1 Tax=Paraglaciecola sp. TaxID=1920173 RepID=UPI00329A4DFD
MNKSIFLYFFSVIGALSVAIFELNYDNKNNLLFIEDAVLINDGSISRIDYLTAVTMMEEEKENPMEVVDYQLIVDRLIEEELLFQYGLEQGYIYQPAISQVIVNNMLETIAIQHTSEKYSDEKLYQVYIEKVVENQPLESLPQEMSFELLKPELAIALKAIERSKAVREYLTWLRKRSIVASFDNRIIKEKGPNNE